MRNAFVRSLTELARRDERIYLLVGDLGYSVVEPFREQFPERFLNVGVAEQNMTGVAAGLALSGKIVFTYSIANFPTLRCLEQIRNDVCYHNANVKIVAVGAGLAYGALGITHHGTEDVAMLRALPGMTVVAPADPMETALATRAVVDWPGPCYLRLGKAGEPGLYAEPPAFWIGKPIELRPGRDVVILTTGPVARSALRAGEKLGQAGIAAGVYSVHTIKPLDEEFLRGLARQTPVIFVVEDHASTGGLGSAVAEVVAEMAGARSVVKRLALPDRFQPVGSQEFLHSAYLSADALFARICEALPGRPAMEFGSTVLRDAGRGNDFEPGSERPSLSLEDVLTGTTMTERSHKLISFCIPTHNRAAYLREALDSILPQLGPDVEVVISDNASTDGTREFVREYQSKCADIRYFSNDTNLGFDRNLLYCLEQAHGEYVWLFGSDDRLCDAAVETVRRRIVQAPVRPVLVYLNHEVVDNQGRLLIRSKIACEKDREFANARACARKLALNLGYMSALVLRREPCMRFAQAGALLGSGWIHLSIGLRCLLTGGSIQYVGRPLVQARRSLSTDYDLTERFVQQAERVFWEAHRHGYPWFAIYRTMNRIVRGQYARFVLAWRCDDAEELARVFPVLFRTCWKYPWFWLLVLPLRYAPPPFLRALRAGLRRLRAWRSARLARRFEGVQASPPAMSGESLASFGLLKSRRER